MSESGFNHISKQVINAWPKGLVGLDAEYKITAISPSATEIIGWTEEELLNKEIHTVLCSNAVDYIHNHNDCPVHTLFSSNDGIKECEAWWISKSGDYTNVNLKAIINNVKPSNKQPSIKNGIPEPTVYLLSFEPCPEEGFSSSQTGRLAQFAEFNPLPMAEINASGSLEYANPSMMGLLVDPGFDDEGHPLVLPANLDEIIQRCIQEKSPIDLIETTTGDLVLQWTFCPVANSFPPVIHAYGQDISEIRKTHQQLEKALDRAQVAARTKSQFLANMSHEIRTPLTAIIGYAESIWDGSLSGMSDHDAMGTIIRNGKQMLQIINDILDLSKIEAQRLQVEQIDTDLGEILVHLDNVYTLLAQDKKLEFKIEVEYPFPQSITSDPVRIKQVLLNLCSNALKFTHEGTICIRSRYLQEQDQIEFQVQDSGIGISEEQANKLFRAFNQADASTTRHYGGTGLGLFISKQLCELLGGDLALDSTPNVGSTFTATISIGDPDRTLCFAHDPESLFSTQEPEKRASIKGSLRGHILLAEDYAENRRLVEMYLNSVGITVREAENGVQALKLGLEEDFDLILMDIQMPEMDGLEATKLLRESGFSKPIIALTANVMEDEIKHYLANGFDDVIGKPIDRSKMFKTMGAYLKEGNAVPTEAEFLVDETPEKPSSSHDPSSHSTEQRTVGSSQTWSFSRQDSKENATNSVEDKEPSQELQQEAAEEETVEEAGAEDDFSDFYSSPEYHALVQSFLSGLGEELDLIEAAVDQKDWNKLQRLVHKMKGAGGSFGFHEISNIATAMDTALKEAENDIALDLYPSLKETVEQTISSKLA